MNATFLKRAAAFFIVLLAVTLSCTKEPDTIPVTNVTLDTSSVELTEGDSFELEARVSPSDASNKKVLWTSSKASVATVESGHIQALSPGEAIITATTDDGGKTATCTVTVFAKVIPVTGVKLAKTSADLLVNEQLLLTATVSPEDATNKTVTWHSSNEKMATVSSSGEVRALSPGTVTITAVTEDGGFSAQCIITITQPVMGISLSDSEVTIVEGESTMLIAKVTPDDANDQRITWESSDAAIATVKDGKVTGKKEGAAVVSATSVDGGYKASCKVIVVAKVIPVTGISLDRHTARVFINSHLTLTASIAPQNATNKAHTWFSSNEKVATVSPSGDVHALSAGETTITVTSEDGGFSDHCSVTVIQPVLSITLSETEMTLDEGESRTIISNVSPDDAYDKSLDWTSSNTSVATVRDGIVTAVKAGTAIITAAAMGGDVSASCTVTVIAHPSSITLNKSTLRLARGSSEVLTATILPANTTNKEVTWNSEDASVATVVNGKVTAVGSGTTSISATTVDGGLSASCEVSVYVPVSGLSLDPSSIKLNVGETCTLSLAISPEDATERDINWSSSNTSVATVQDGVVKALKNGTATIKATSSNNISATCVVTVVIPVTGITISKQTLVLEQYSSASLTATVQPSNATDKSVVWESKDPSIATVTNGTVKGLLPGETEITVTTNDGHYSASCAVTVEKEKPKATSLSFGASSVFASDTPYTLQVKVTPEDAACNFTWQSSSSSVVVNSNGTITASSASTSPATITVRDTRSGLTASISAYTYIQNFSWQETGDGSYSGFPLVTIANGGTHQLKYTCNAGSNVLNLFGDYSNFVFYEPSYVVDSPSNISITPDGLVKGIKNGTTGIKTTGLVSSDKNRLYFKVVSSLYESEYNDSQDYANSVPYGIPMSFDLMNTSDVDWFKLLSNSSSSGYVNMTISVEYPNASSLSDNQARLCKYSLYDSSMQLWGAGSFSFSNSATIASTTRQVPNGPLFIKIYFDSSYSSALFPQGTLKLRMAVD